MITNKGQLALIAYNRSMKDKTYAERYGVKRAEEIMEMKKPTYALALAGP